MKILKTKKTFKQRFGIPLTYLFLPLFMFIITSLPGLKSFVPFMSLVLVAAIIAARFISRAPFWLNTVLWVLLVLSLVGATGWFYSPFFFALYLLGIALGFIYTPLVATFFVIALILMFAFNVAEVNASYDFLTLLSLLTVVPITIALRRKFLILQQSRKGILILEQEGDEPGITSLDQVLKNRVNSIGTRLRQPLTYLKQGLALLDGNELTEEEFPDVLSRMRKAVEELFTLDREFERDSTKNNFMNNKEETKPELVLRRQENVSGEIKKPKGV